MSRLPIFTIIPYSGIVWNWFRRKPLQTGSSLTGAPALPRQKTYSAATGWVYQYIYRGQRKVAEPPATEYVFAATRDRKNYFPVAVVLREGVAEDWAKQGGRSLLPAEHYAIAKMSLFEAFDEYHNVEQFSEAITPDVPMIQRFLGAMGRL